MFHSTRQSMASKAFVESIKAMYRGRLCSRNFSCSWCAVKITTVVPLDGWKSQSLPRSAFPSILCRTSGLLIPEFPDGIVNLGEGRRFFHGNQQVVLGAGLCSLYAQSHDLADQVMGVRLSWGTPGTRQNSSSATAAIFPLYLPHMGKGVEKVP